MTHPLRKVSFEWHDLPVGRLSIDAGGVDIELRPFCEASQSFRVYVLRLSDAEALKLNVTGEFSGADLEGLEVTSFTFEGDGDRISGKLGLIPGCPSLGYWELGFVQARWYLFKPLQ